MTKHISNCNFAIDLTEGDSFSDIYGNRRFEDWTTIKEIVEKSGVPLILGSQTYGPFYDERNKRRASQVIKSAVAVIARDKISADYVKKISGVEPILTCDLAFRLPYIDRSDKRSENGELRKIGLNISGLLTSGGDEGKDTDKSFRLETSYDQFVDVIIQSLLDNNYEVHLIGHVAEDYSVNNEFKAKYPAVVLAPEFDNPVDAKSYISSMDLFIGSRMHATIAALTSNTPVIPVAYSRKFKGLFDSVKYPYVVDLQNVRTEDAVKKVEELIKNYHVVKEQTQKSYQIAMNMNEECVMAYEKVILKLLER